MSCYTLPPQDKADKVMSISSGATWQVIDHRPFLSTYLSIYLSIYLMLCWGPLNINLIRELLFPTVQMGELDKCVDALTTVKIYQNDLEQEFADIADQVRTALEMQVLSRLDDAALQEGLKSLHRHVVEHGACLSKELSTAEHGDRIDAIETQMKTLSKLNETGKMLQELHYPTSVARLDEIADTVESIVDFVARDQAGRRKVLSSVRNGLEAILRDGKMKVWIQNLIHHMKEDVDQPGTAKEWARLIAISRDELERPGASKESRQVALQLRPMAERLVAVSKLEDEHAAAARATLHEAAQRARTVAADDAVVQSGLIAQVEAIVAGVLGIQEITRELAKPAADIRYLAKRLGAEWRKSEAGMVGGSLLQAAHRLEALTLSAKQLLAKIQDARKYANEALSTLEGKYMARGRLPEANMVRETKSRLLRSFSDVSAGCQHFRELQTQLGGRTVESITSALVDLASILRGVQVPTVNSRDGGYLCQELVQILLEKGLPDAGRELQTLCETLRPVDATIRCVAKNFRRIADTLRNDTARHADECATQTYRLADGLNELAANLKRMGGRSGQPTTNSVALKIMKSALARLTLQQTWSSVKRWQDQVLVRRCGDSLSKVHSCRLIKRSYYRVLKNGRGIALLRWRDNMESEDRERGQLQLVTMQITALSLLKAWRTMRQCTSRAHQKGDRHQRATALWQDAQESKALNALVSVTTQANAADRSVEAGLRLWAGVHESKAWRVLAQHCQDASERQQSTKSAVLAWRLQQESRAWRVLSSNCLSKGFSAKESAAASYFKRKNVSHGVTAWMLVASVEKDSMDRTAHAATACHNRLLLRGFTRWVVWREEYMEGQRLALTALRYMQRAILARAWVTWQSDINYGTAHEANMKKAVAFGFNQALGSLIVWKGMASERRQRRENELRRLRRVEQGLEILRRTLARWSQREMAAAVASLRNNGTFEGQGSTNHFLVKEWMTRWQQGQLEIVQLERQEWEARKESLMCKRRLQDVIRATRQKEASSLILRWKSLSLAWALVLWKSLIDLERCSVLTEQLEAAQSSAQRVLHQTSTPESWQSFEQWCVIHDVASDSVLQHEISLVRTECKLSAIEGSWQSQCSRNR